MFVWYFIVSIPDLCTLTYFVMHYFVHSSFAIILKRKRSWLLCNYCLTDVLIITLNFRWLFLTVPCVGLQQCVIVVFPDHTPLLFESMFKCMYTSFP